MSEDFSEASLQPGNPASADGWKTSTARVSGESVENDPDLKSQTKEMQHTEMEVHHHPQLNHKPKPWKEYLLEGLMIFVAVMMGFFAENIREGVTNREHVQELVSQLVRDLQDDTIQLHGIIQAETEILHGNDTLIDMLQRPLDAHTTGRLEELMIRSHNIWLFYPSTGAIAAIKNELHLRQFSSSKIIGLIARYQSHVDLLHTVQDISLQYQRNYLDPFLLQHFTANSLRAAFEHDASVPAATRNLSKDDLEQFAANMVLIRINTDELVRDNRGLLQDATILLQYVKEQFGTGNE